MESKLLHRKVGIILATVDVIDQLGIHGLSTREVAKRAGISEPTIFKHFKSKNDLLLAVLDHFSQYDSDIILSVQTKRLKPLDAIIYYVNTYATYYENYPAITAITQIYDVLRCDPNLSEKAKSIFFARTDFMIEMVKQAQRNGEINPDIDGGNLALIIMGMVSECCLDWRMWGYCFSLKERTLSTLRMVLDAFRLRD